MSETAPVAVVTGASRGAGRGIALALGSHGCTVYVTGRSEKAGDATLPGTIYETAAAVTAAGGKGIAVRVDHGVDSDVEALFQQVEAEQGRLDILVNNACALHDDLTNPGHFWEKPLGIVNMLDVGLRSSYVASYYAAPLMVKQKNGLIMFTSASGSVHYVYGPVYGAHKAGMDKFAADMAVDLIDFNVTAVSVWMGALQAERLQMVIDSDPDKYRYLLEHTETPEFTGHVIWHIYNDPERMQLSGQTVIGAEMAIKYDFQDSNGRQPASCRAAHGVEPRIQHPYIIR
ncbi:SDR family NAD(P)-dependent oxidoreductase [Aestuariicella hydrocarbonica]|uniref:SDR family NAD(P)-dependent oxidoreductase n=1 Tax=Pseudomaricurvus hydrocarbonicus TaxID=1470433 RepID=A0A9E5JWS7_9GAMM|nr:SDR family NAD(P)-dependent oxidoreductase [Aestuariicella hydrocarbonica]NHO65996.1 SDR family NAD(P)-dependent oxidoreductase [Aestuariicella hydrocarbonica]